MIIGTFEENCLDASETLCKSAGGPFSESLRRGAFLILIFKHIKLLHLKHAISPKIPVNDQSVTDFNIVGNYRDLAKCHGYGRYIRVKILEGWGNI